MKHFLLSCFTLISLSACHVENGYYYDVPSYNSYHEHRHHDFGRRHDHRRDYIIPNNRHGHNEVIVIPDSRRPSHNHGHDDRRSHGHGSEVIIGNPGANSNGHGHR